MSKNHVCAILFNFDFFCVQFGPTLYHKNSLQTFFQLIETVAVTKLIGFTLYRSKV